MHPMDATQTLAALDLLDGLDVTIGGGWGVDALVGHQTREHDDLDLYLPRSLFPEAVERLAGAGFVEHVDWLPGRLAMLHPDGREIDLHPYDPQADGSGRFETHTGEVFIFPVEAFSSGRVAGRIVACWSVAFQVTAHSGYEPSDKDLHDLALLDRLEG